MLGESAEPWKKSIDSRERNNPTNTTVIIGVLQSIQHAFQNNLLLTVADLIRAEAFDNLLEQGEYLFTEGYHLAAGVLGRAVFEEHLREWCALKSCTPANAKPTLSNFIDSLYKDKHISATLMKHFVAIAGVGNDAAHNLPSLNKEDVERMLRDVREVLVRHPLS